MFEDIQKHRQAVAENIEKSLQIGYTESEDLEKAHNVGDVHPNGKWVWTQLPSGKYDWRTIKKTSNPVSGNVSTQQAVDDAKAKMAAGVAAKKQTSKSSVNGANTFEDVLSAYQKGGINAVQMFDGKLYNLVEYENQKKQALKVDDAARTVGKQLVEENIKETQQKLNDTKRNHPSAAVALSKLMQSMAKYNAQLKAIEDAEEELKKSPKAPTFKLVPDTYIKHGNLSSKDFKDLYQKAYDAYKDESADAIWDKIMKNQDTYKNAVIAYSSMKRTANATQINKQGNLVDKLAAEKYILNHLWEEKQ